MFKSTFRSGYDDIADLHMCVCFLQHSSVDGFVEPPAPPTKSASRHSLPRCRNSFTLSTTEEQPHIGNYRLLKTIGKGNFAKVKLARHVLTGREVRQKCYLYFIDNLGITVIFTSFSSFSIATCYLSELHLTWLFWLQRYELFMITISENIAGSWYTV